MAIQTATNPETGERVALINGSWVPFTRSATNDQGQKAFLVGGKWVTDGPVAAPKPEEGGFFSNVGNLLVEGGKSALSAAEISPAVISGGVDKDQAETIAKELGRKRVEPKALKEVQAAFADEGADFKKAEGFMESLGPIARTIGEVGRQAITNPEGLVYLTAQSAANIAPSIAGMLGGAKLGGMAGTAVAPGVGTAIGTLGGGVAGAFAGSAPLEIGMEFTSLVGQELQRRGLEPTEANVAKLLEDQKFVEQAVGNARVKGSTTAGIDAATTLLGGRFATGASRAAAKAAQAELGAGATAAQIANRAEELLKARTLPQKVGRGAGAVGIDVAGGGLSEAGGQLAAYGEVDLQDVGLEMLGELGGSAIEIPAAARALRESRPAATPEQAPPAEPELAETEPAAPVAPAAPEVAVEETPAQVTARRIAELEEDFPPLTRPTLGPVAAEVEQALEPLAAPVAEEVAPAAEAVVPTAAAPSEEKVVPFGETRLPPRQASIEDEMILQNRDRSTEASIGQMQSIAAKPDYGRMSFSRDLANGAPVVFGGTVEPTRMGVQDVAIATDGRRIPTQYAVVEANEVLASNTVDGSVNEAYAASPESTRAIAGNGRIAGIQAAYQRGNADNYKAELLADARLHGVDPAVIESMKAPVLVRFMPREFVTRDIGDVSNISTGLELSAAEKAKNDLQRVDLDSVQFSDEGNITPTSVMEFIRAMPETERGGLLDNGKPSAQAFDRLRSAVFAKAYDNDELIRIYSQSEDEEVRVIFNALSKVAPKMSRLAGTGDFDIRDIVTSAAELALNARRSGVPIMRAAQQIDITADPDVYAVLEMFARNSRSAKNVARYLGNLADSAYAEATKPTEDFFGEVPKRSRAELIEQARKEDEQEAADKSLEEQGGRKPSQEDDVQAGAEPRRAKPTGQDQGETAVDPDVMALVAADNDMSTFLDVLEFLAREKKTNSALSQILDALPTGTSLEPRMGRVAWAVHTNPKASEDTKKRAMQIYEDAYAPEGEELELKPATPETFQAAEKRAAQAPKELEADQIRRESEAGADQFRLEGGEGRQDLTGKLFQQDEATPDGIPSKLWSQHLRAREAEAKAEGTMTSQVKTAATRTWRALSKMAKEFAGSDQAAQDLMERMNTISGIREAMRDEDGAALAAYKVMSPDLYAQEVGGGDGMTGQLFQQDSGVAGDEIIVDGKVRPTKNSKGQLIESTPEKLRNFWRWVGDLPLHESYEDRSSDRGVYKLYHMTTADFDEFIPGGLSPMDSGPAIFLSTDPAADSATFRVGSEERGFREGARTMPVYAKLSNPLVIDSKEMLNFARESFADGSREFPQLISKEIVEALKAEGYDSVIFDGKGVGWKNAANEILVFDPIQIKSAIGNEGSYSDQSPKILESKESGKGWDIDPAEQAMERELVGKSVDEIGQWVVDNAPNQFTKVIAQKVQARIREMQRRGVNMKIEVLTGDRRPMSMYSSRGSLSYTFSKGKPADMVLKLNGAAVVNNQAGYPPGMRYTTVLHEMLHMATTAQTAGLKSDHPLIRELNDIRNKVVAEFNKRVKAGNLSDFESRIYNRTINALANTDEILAWGLTDTDMQKFMASIKVGEKTLFDKFVELMRKVLGLDVDYESAMDRLVKTSDQLLDMSIDEVAKGIEQRGYMFGPAQPRLQPGDTMQGELFSAQQPMSKPPVGKQRLNIFNQTPLSQWTKPDETKMADFVYTMQDKLVDTKDVVKAIQEQVGKIEEQWNPYLQEELYHGRTAKQTNDFLSNEMRPLVKMMDRMGVSIDELDTYLHNRIAEQRNKQAAALNPKLQDGGSGIMTADARAYLAGLTKEQKAKYEQLAKKVDEISQGTRDLLVDTGLESQETVDAWEAENPNYVPLFREDVDYGVTKEVTTGLGFNTKGGTSKRFMGSQRKVVNILANIAMQRERAIVRSNKNRVAVATYGLAVKNPNPGFWLAVNPDAKNPKKVIDELMEMGLSEEDAKGVMQEPVQARIERKKNPKTGLMEEQIVYEVNPAARGKFDVFASRVNGQDRYVFFNGNDPRAARMVTALKNLDADSLGRAMGMAATITRYFAAINTQYNPIFGAFNFLRDMQGAAIQVSNTPLAGKRADIMAGAFPALKGIYSSLRADTKGKTAPMGQWAKLWDEFQQEGGQTGFRDQFSRSDERAAALEKELKQISENKAKKSVRAIFDWLSDYNDAMENALRLSAYKAGLDKGLSKQEAASVAKNLTVNFNRKGQIGVQANALYAFFNAAVQGTARLLQTLGTVENGKFRLTKVGKTILGGGFLLGSLQALALAAAGFDDDEPPQFIRERNFIIPTGDGKYLTFPMPLGYNVIPNTSRIITEFVLSGGKDPAKRVADITTAFLDMFNPIGNAGWSAQTIAPTIADPLVALTENKDWTGKPIAREDFSNLDPTPGYTRAKETASWFSKNLSEFLNFATGGTSYKPGVFSPTPDQIDYLIGVAFGGVGREALKVEQTITGAFTGEEVPTYKIPLAGRFFGDTKAAASEANKFYTNLKELNQHKNEIEGRRKNKEDVAGYIRENPEARLANAAGTIERNVQALRKKRRELVESGAPKEKVQQIEKQITAQMKRLNDMVDKLEK